MGRKEFVEPAVAQMEVVEVSEEGDKGSTQLWVWTKCRVKT